MKPSTYTYRQDARLNLANFCRKKKKKKNIFFCYEASSATLYSFITKYFDGAEEEKKAPGGILL